jgi:hypothetical protein
VSAAGTCTCGCCQPPAPRTPQAVANRPGLPAVRYRVGTFASFREAMVEAAAGRPELRGWTSREPDDFGMALLAMWAWIGDVLTFYQERAANEAFIRTALLPESVRRLAGLLGYEPTPGGAAIADLAFTLDDGRQVVLPSGLQVQSVPGEGERPQRFETGQAVPADARLNEVRVGPAPRSRPGGALAAGSDHGLLLDPVDAGAGDQVVVVLVPRVMADPRPGAEQKILTGAEEKTLTDVEQADGRSRLSWSPPVRDSNGGLVMRRWTRKFVLFGHDAPASYTTVTGTGEHLTWSRVVTDFNAPAEKAVYLDSVVDGLAPGAEILLVNDGISARILRVTGVGRAGASIGASGAQPALEATVTKLNLELGETEAHIGVADVREAVVYELAGPPIRFWNFEYPDRVDGDTVYVPLSARPDLAALAASAVGRLAILDDRQARPQTVTLTRVRLADVDGDSQPDHLELRFSTKLERALDSASAVLWGNVARATHGETVAAEMLGDGDAATGLQAFGLAKRPLTYVPAPGTPGGVTSTLRVEANGMRWEETPTLFGRGPGERVYTLRRDDEGATVVRFGDGRAGARLPTGRGNVVAGYRAGLGTDGRVRAGTLTNPRTRPVGLRRVTNPGPASGGADPEAADQTRASAPNTVRTFGRVVSLRDFEDAALQVAGVGKARAAAVWDGEEQVVQLTVAGDEGAQVTGPVLEQLVADLDRRRAPNRALRPVPYHEVPVQVVGAIRVRSGYVPETALASARAALLALFAFDRREFGQPVHLSDVYRALQEADGVAAAMVTRLRRKPPADAISPPEIETPLPVGPSELAALREPATDADIRIE